jgi:competence protein ComEA
MRTLGFFTLAVLLPVFASAATLININTADATLLDTLPGIGPTKATAIIDYRTANGPFLRIEDIQNVSGIGPSTYADIAPLITVGDTNTSNTSNTSDTASSTPPSTASTTENTTALSSGGGAPPEYIPIPTLRIITGGARTISSGADTAFTAVVYDGRGSKRDDALVTWSFGDGMKRTGASVFHAYYDPGEYIVIVHATTSDGGDMLVENIVNVKDASIKIASVSARGIALTNNSSRTLDLSSWRLSAGGKEFKIPTDTQILTGRTILFPSQIIQLPISNTASLLYPSGEVAAVYPPVSIASASGRQPSVPQASFNNVQAVEPVISTKKNIQAYEEAVVAPAAATELAAAGAALPVAPLADSPRNGGLFRSPWFLGLIGVVALAGTAFIFL